MEVDPGAGVQGVEDEGVVENDVGRIVDDGAEKEVQKLGGLKAGYYHLVFAVQGVSSNKGGHWARTG